MNQNQKAAGHLRLYALGAVVFLCGGCGEKPAPKAQPPVARVAEQNPTPEPLPTPSLNDFTTSNFVGCALGGEEHGTGVELNEKERDGRSTVVKVGEVPCRLMSPRTGTGGDPAGYLYFSLDPAFKQAGARRVKIEVEYFDVVFGGNPVAFSIQYDASGEPTPHTYASAGASVRLRGSETWQTATFQIADATFQNAQNGRADFRVRASPPELYVRRVTVTRVGDGR